MNQLDSEVCWDVVIVGAGLVGLTCALALAQQDLRVLVLEARNNPQVDFPLPEDPIDVKVVALSPTSEQFLARLGIWDLIKGSRNCPYLHMKVWDSVADGEIFFSALDYFEPHLGHIIEQRVILAALWQKLQAYSQVTIRSGVTVTGFHEEKSHLELRINSEVVRTCLLIGADGANSLIRRMGQFAIKGWAYEQSAIIATVEVEKSHDSTAFQRFSRDGTLALLPLSNAHDTSIVWATSPGQAKELCQHTPERFNQILTRESQSILGQLRVVGERFQIPLRTHHAKSYVISRCALVGDAAHTMHPLAGQGVNLGFLDVISLVHVLVNAKARKRDIGALHILQRYDRDRRWHNQIMIWAMELFKRGFMSQSSLLLQLRNQGLNWVDKRVTLKQFFAKFAMGKFQHLAHFPFES